MNTAAGIQWQAFAEIRGYASHVYPVRDTEAAALEDIRAASSEHARVELFRRVRLPDNHIRLERVRIVTTTAAGSPAA